MRIKSLDILRGLTVVLMIVVNNPGSWEHTFPCLRHAAWNGFTITDMVFPSFIFIIGASVWMAFRKCNHELNKVSSIKIIKRGLLIYIVGILLNWFPFYDFYSNEFISFSHVRLVGVFPRIALVYIIGSFIVLTLKEIRKLAIAIFSLLALYTLIVYGMGDDSLDNYIGIPIDVIIFGNNHLYHGYGCTFDPEGVLGTMSSLCTMMMGYISAMLINRTKDFVRNILEMMSTGGLLLLCGMILDYWIPINKPIWSASYVLLTAGISMLMWGIFAYWYDVKKKSTLESVINTFGTNALFTYLLGDVISVLSGIPLFSIDHSSLFGYIYNLLLPITSENIASLISAISLVFICWCAAYPLFKKHIYIKL